MGDKNVTTRWFRFKKVGEIPIPIIALMTMMTIVIDCDDWNVDLANSVTESL